MDIDTVRLFAISKLGWIRKQQAHFREQERESQREYIDRESHYLWAGATCFTWLKSMRRRPSSWTTPPDPTGAPFIQPREEAAIVEEWYRRQLKAAAVPLIAKWEPILGVKVERFFVQRMKTRWAAATRAREPSA